MDLEKVKAGMRDSYAAKCHVYVCRMLSDLCDGQYIHHFDHPCCSPDLNKNSESRLYWRRMTDDGSQI